MKSFYNDKELTNPNAKPSVKFRKLDSKPANRMVHHVSEIDNDEMVHHEGDWHRWGDVKKGYNDFNYLSVKDRVKQPAKTPKKRRVRKPKTAATRQRPAAESVKTTKDKASKPATPGEVKVNKLPF